MRSISTRVRPLAYSPPTTAPMLVPAIASIGTCMLFEHLEYADVRDPAGPAAGEHQPDARPAARRSHWRAYPGDSGGAVRRERRAARRATGRREETRVPRDGALTARVKSPREE